MTHEGMTALVTGASRGIGRAIAGALASRGATVYLASRNLAALEKGAAEIREQGGRAFALRMDVCRQEEIAGVIDTIVRESSRLEILVNNAGLRRDRLAVRLHEEEWQEVLEVNLSGTSFCMQKALPVMSRFRFGRIINMASVVAFSGNPGQANYAAAKAGIAGLTRAVAREYDSRGITVNAVAPGLVETEMTSGLEDRTYARIVEQIPAGRPGTPAEVAAAVAFLASREAGYITGQVIQVNGGLYM